MNSKIINAPQDEIVIRIRNDASILVEKYIGGIINSKFINPDDLFSCIKDSSEIIGIESGILPENTVFYREEQDKTRRIIMKVASGYHDIIYHNTLYPAFSLPAMVFGFTIKPDGRISSKKLSIVDDLSLKNESKLYYYPFSNINQSNYEICIGQNTLPVIKEVRYLSSIPHLIISMPNNDDSYKSKHNLKNLDYRELLEYLKDKTPQAYYDEVLVKSGKVFDDFIKALKM